MPVQKQNLVVGLCLGRRGFIPPPPPPEGVSLSLSLSLSFCMIIGRKLDASAMVGFANSLSILWKNSEFPETAKVLKSILLYQSSYSIHCRFPYSQFQIPNWTLPSQTEARRTREDRQTDKPPGSYFPLFPLSEEKCAVWRRQKREELEIVIAFMQTRPFHE